MSSYRKRKSIIQVYVISYIFCTFSWFFPVLLKNIKWEEHLNVLSFMQVN